MMSFRATGTPSSGPRGAPRRNRSSEARAASCALGPAAVFAWHVDTQQIGIRLAIERAGTIVFEGATDTGSLVRKVDELAAVLHGAYTLPHGAWLLTGTGIVPQAEFTLRAGDEIAVSVEGLGSLHNRVRVVRHSGAAALPRNA